MLLGTAPIEGDAIADNPNGAESSVRGRCRIILGTDLVERRRPNEIRSYHMIATLEIQFKIQAEYVAVSAHRIGDGCVAHWAVFK